MESLCIAGWYTAPSKVKDMVEITHPAGKGMHKANISSAQALSYSIDHGLPDDCVSEVQVNAWKERQLRENSDPKMLGLEEAITSLERMPYPPSAETLKCTLHKCRKNKNLMYAQRLHAFMCKNELATHRSLGNYLLALLVDVGSIHDAQQVFNRLVYRNEYSWTCLMIGYIECGEPQHALNLYQKMQEDYVSPNEYTFMALLKACARLNDAERGLEIHAEIARKGLLEKDAFVGNALVDMYAKCGSLVDAREVFDKLPVRDNVSWNALIAGYAKHGSSEEALNCFECMQVEGVSPDAPTFVCCLKACGNIGDIEKGQQVHAEIAMRGMETSLFVGSTLVDMYAKCGLPAKAHDVFDKLLVRDVVSWNALIAGYAKHGVGEEALNCFDQMQLEGLSPDAATFVCSLKACGSIGAMDTGLEIHAEIVKRGLERDLLVGSTLVDMYAKCGLPAKAQEAFDKLPVRDVVSWSALMSGYVKHGLSEEALNCFQQMQLEGILPDALVFVCSLQACSSIGAIVKGQEIHVEIARRGLERDFFIGSTLVDMYAKFGLLAKAWKAFDRLPVKDVVSWNALIAGYAHVGESESVFKMLERMRREGIEPDEVTFLNVLTVCNHTGLVDDGLKYFKAMIKDYGINPTIEHHTCMIDLLGRAGQLHEVVAMIKEMLFYPDLAVWHAVLGACRTWGNVELGKKAFEHAVQLDEKDPAAYVLMSNIFADACMQEDEKVVNAMRLKAQAWKKPRLIGGHCQTWRM